MVVDLLRGVLDADDDDGEGVALVDVHGPMYTLAGLEHTVAARAEELAAAGVAGGRIHTIAAAQSHAGVIELLAAWRLGATVAPLNARLTERELASARAALQGKRSTAQAILWTSGTSGRPRGVELSFENLRVSAEAVSERLSLSWRDTWLATLSHAHVGGLTLIVRALLNGSYLVVGGPFDAELTGRLIDEPTTIAGFDRPVTHVSLVPLQLRRLLEQREGRPPPESFQCALIGGAHAPTELVREALDLGWPLALTYGMTEMTSQVATAPPELVARKPGTVGRPLEGVDLRVAADGELLVRGPTRAVGYVGTDAGQLVDSDGWYHTGDLGRIDTDGDLWITGRRIDRIVTGGVNVDAVEVEEVLRSHPTVVDACVVGVPDEEWGERVSAWVVPVEGEFDLDALETWLADHLAAAKRPRRWVVDRALPLNANGKTDRALVRELIQGA